MVRSATEAPRIFCGHIEQRFANVNWSAIVAQEHFAVSKLSQSVTGRSGFFASTPSHFLMRALSFAILVRKSFLHALRQNRSPQYWW